VGRVLRRPALEPWHTRSSCICALCTHTAACGCGVRSRSDLLGSVGLLKRRAMRSAAILSHGLPALQALRTPNPTHNTQQSLAALRSANVPRPSPTGMVDQMLANKDVNIWWLPDEVERLIYVSSPGPRAGVGGWGLGTLGNVGGSLVCARGWHSSLTSQRSLVSPSLSSIQPLLQFNVMTLMLQVLDEVVDGMAINFAGVRGSALGGAGEVRGATEGRGRAKCWLALRGGSSTRALRGIQVRDVNAYFCPSASAAGADGSGQADGRANCDRPLNRLAQTRLLPTPKASKLGPSTPPSNLTNQSTAQREAVADIPGCGQGGELQGRRQDRGTGPEGAAGGPAARATATRQQRARLGCSSRSHGHGAAPGGGAHFIDGQEICGHIGLLHHAEAAQAFGLRRLRTTHSPLMHARDYGIQASLWGCRETLHRGCLTTMLKLVSPSARQPGLHLRIVFARSCLHLWPLQRPALPPAQQNEALKLSLCVSCLCY
jgi:hypothetical protein